MPREKRVKPTDSELTEADLRRYDPRKADLMPFPFYGKILPRPLKVGQAAKGTLEGGVDDLVSLTLGLVAALDRELGERQAAA